MNFKTTVILMVVLAIVGVLIVVDRLSAPDAAPAARVEQGKPVKLLQDPIDATADSLSITSDAGQVSVARQADGRWQLTKPFVAPADAVAVSGVLARLSTTNTKGRAGQAAETGFQPTVTVNWSLTGGGKGTLLLGTPNAVGEALARLETAASDNVAAKTGWVTVPADLVEGLKKRPEEFRDPQLIRTLPTEIRSLVLLSPGPGGTDTWVRLVRQAGAGGVGGEAGKAEGGWLVSEGAGPAPDPTAPADANALRADDAAVEDLLTALTSLRAAEFPKPAGAGNPFATPQLIVRYSTAGADLAGADLAGAGVGGSGGVTTQPAVPARTSVVQVGRWEDARRERVFLSTDDVGTALVTAFSVGPLRKTALELRDKRVVDIRPADVTKIEIVNEPVATTRPSERTVLVRRTVTEPAAIVPPIPMPSTQPGMKPELPSTLPVAERQAWLLESADVVHSPEADVAKVDALLESLRPLRAQRFLSGAAATQPSTPWLLRVTTTSGATELRLGASAGRLGELKFDLAADLTSQLAGPFTKPRPAIPFIDAADPASGVAPTTGPASVPAAPSESPAAP